MLLELERSKCLVAV